MRLLLKVFSYLRPTNHFLLYDVEWAYYAVCPEPTPDSLPKKLITLKTRRSTWQGNICVYLCRGIPFQQVSIFHYLSIFDLKPQPKYTSPPNVVFVGECWFFVLGKWAHKLKKIQINPGHLCFFKVYLTKDLIFRCSLARKYWLLEASKNTEPENVFGDIAFFWWQNRGGPSYRTDTLVRPLRPIPFRKFNRSQVGWETWNICP